MTRTRTVCATAALAAVAVMVGSGETLPGDWPQWRGPERTGISKESGLLQQWPAAGPRLVWQTANLGQGYGAVATSGDQLFVQGLRNRQSIVSALNRATGQVVWSKALGSGEDNGRGPGPRGTPTVDGDRLYVLTENGDLACLKHDGTLAWQRNILRDFKGSNITWLISESPLVDGNVVIVSPGGRNAGMVALDKMTGQTVWTTKDLNDEAGYASPVVADIHGIRTVMTLTAEGGVGVRASDGKLMWKYRPVANSTANITTPIFFDNKVFRVKFMAILTRFMCRPRRVTVEMSPVRAHAHATTKAKGLEKHCATSFTSRLARTQIQSGRSTYLALVCKRLITASCQTLPAASRVVCPSIFTAMVIKPALSATYRMQ